MDTASTTVGAPETASTSNGSFNTPSTPMDEASSEIPPTSVRHVILVLSGKGGVGKSMTTSRLAVALHARKEEWKIGVLDVDLCGPSVPRIFGVAGKAVHNCSEGWVPVFVDESTQRLSVMSIGFLLKSYDNDAIVWRGPKKNAMVKQFLTDVCWGPLDFLLVDTPPGTGDEHISIVEAVQAQYPCATFGAVLVTTPQAVSVDDVRRQITFCRKTGVKILGVVENMSGFVCPNCNNCANVFSKGGGSSLAEQMGVRFLGDIPIDPKIAQSMDSGLNLLQTQTSSHVTVVVDKMIESLI